MQRLVQYSKTTSCEAGEQGTLHKEQAFLNVGLTTAVTHQTSLTLTITEITPKEDILYPFFRGGKSRFTVSGYYE